MGAFCFTHCNKTLQFSYKKWGTDRWLCESYKCYKRELFQNYPWEGKRRDHEKNCAVVFYVLYVLPYSNDPCINNYLLIGGITICAIFYYFV